PFVARTAACRQTTRTARCCCATTVRRRGRASPRHTYATCCSKSPAYRALTAPDQPSPATTPTHLGGTMCYGYDGHAALDAATERAGMGRRKLLAGALGTAAVGALGVASTSPAAAESTESAARWGWGRIPPHRISIQLYSIREDLEKNYKRSLRYVAETGYPRVEQAGY